MSHIASIFAGVVGANLALGVTYPIGGIVGASVGKLFDIFNKKSFSDKGRDIGAALGMILFAAAGAYGGYSLTHDIVEHYLNESEGKQQTIESNIPAQQTKLTLKHSL